MYIYKGNIRIIFSAVINLQSHINSVEINSIERPLHLQVSGTQNSQYSAGNLDM